MGAGKDCVELKKEQIQYYLDRLAVIAEETNKKSKYDMALSALSSYCSMQYNSNQVYTDVKAETLVRDISKKIVRIPMDYKPEKNTVLFYDGFGLDLRGWAAAYTRALVKDGYHLVYATNKRQKDKIPHILAEMKGSDADVCFIDMNKGFLSWIDQLNDVFAVYQPGSAFFYTMPNDVAAAAVFDVYAGKVDRFQIDLTDHAFWIGVNAADYFFECRIPGASNAVYKRGISKDMLINIDCCLYINRDIDDTELPFDIKKEKYIFSGGALYKTLGDDGLLFYKVLEKVLKQNQDIKYLYAGEGDTSEMLKLSSKYPGRVFHIHERPDFYRLLENCEFMWNTYPMFGGLMMRLSANAGKIPVTLKHGKDHEGLLKNQSELGIEFDTYEEVIEEMNRLLTDDVYKRNKEDRLKGSVLTEDEFARNLKMIIEEHKSEFAFEEIPYINTDDFRKTYLERIEDLEQFAARNIISRNNLRLAMMFPKLLLIRIKDKLFKG